jgi:N-acetylglucosamine kinase
VGSARGLERLDTVLNGTIRDSRALLAAWLAGEAQARAAVELYLDLLAGPLAMVLNLTGASLVPVGGGLSNVAPLVDALDRAVRARILRRTADPVVRPAILGADAGLIGAALLALGSPAGG